MTWDCFMHGVGIGCLIAIAGISAGIITVSLRDHWHRIWPRVCGEIIVGDGPRSPTASVLPLRTSLPLLRTVEADAQLTNSELAA